MTSRQELAMMALAQDLEQPGSDLLGQAFVNPDVVADRVSCRGDRGGMPFEPASKNQPSYEWPRKENRLIAA